MNRILLDCEPPDYPEVPDQVDWYCKQEYQARKFNKVLKGKHLKAFVCDVCRYAIHPVDLVLAGVIQEGKYSKRPFYL